MNKLTREDMLRHLDLLERRDKDWRDLKIDEYGGKAYFTASEGKELLKKLILSEKAVLIGKFGETELRTVYTFLCDWCHLNNIRRASYEICNNAGFFPRRISSIRKFCKEYVEAMRCIDYLGMSLWKTEEVFASTLNDSFKGSFSMGVLDPLHLDNPWTIALEKKRVLVIHPFAESIRRQYNEKRKEIFKNSELYLPDFKLLTVKAVQSIGGKGTIEFATWFDALEYMKSQIDALDFDIALIGCGAYGLPLGKYIKDKNKQAIHLGGSLQLLFGILGGRWENQDYVKRFINENWIRPSKEETPKNYTGIEGGCYW